jgi:hypothetical protein
MLVLGLVVGAFIGVLVGVVAVRAWQALEEDDDLSVDFCRQVVERVERDHLGNLSGGYYTLAGDSRRALRKARRALERAEVRAARGRARTGGRGDWPY